MANETVLDYIIGMSIGASFPITALGIIYKLGYLDDYIEEAKEFYYPSNKNEELVLPVHLPYETNHLTDGSF